MVADGLGHKDIRSCEPGNRQEKCNLFYSAKQNCAAHEMEVFAESRRCYSTGTSCMEQNKTAAKNQNKESYEGPSTPCQYDEPFERLKSILRSAYSIEQHLRDDQTISGEQ